MKRRAINILMGICAMAFVCSVGSAMYLTEAEEKAAEAEQPALVMQDGASIRYFAPVGIRFVTNVSAEDYNKITKEDKNAEFGTLIIPNDMLNEGESLTLNTANALKIVAENWLEDTETTKSFTGVLVGTDNGDGTYADFPDKYYNRNLHAVSYCSYNDTVIYASKPQTYSVAYIASSLLAKGDTDAFLNEIITSVFGTEKLSFAENSYTVYEEETAVTALTDAKGLKVVYSSSDESVVKVDEKGVLTGVKNGEAKITVAIGDMKATADVTVNEKQLIDLPQTQHVDVSLWDMNGDKANLLSDYPAAAEIAAMREKTVSIALPEEIKGTVKAINVGYARGEENILRGSNEDGTVNVQPSYFGYNMGEKVVTVVTDCAYYKLPMAFYTMKISNADELDAFRYYTTYQYGLTETKTQGEYAPTLYDGYFVLDANIIYNDYSQQNLAPIKSFAEQNAHLWNDEIYDTLVGNGFRKYKSFITDNDKAKFNNIAANAYGFIGTFDGCGYNIAGLFIDRASQNANECGGFIGHLTKNVSQGTIQNTSFTDVIYGNFYLSKNNSTLGTVGGFLYTYNLQAVVRNIYIKASCIYGNVPLMGSVANNWSAQISSDDAIWENVLCEVVNTDDSNANNYVLGRFSVYDHKPIVRNLYAVVYKNMKTDKPFQGVSLENGNSQNINVRKEAFATLTGDNSLATHLNGDYTGWDTEYWDTSSGAPVFKTK